MGRIKQSQITYWCHEIIRSQAEAGGCYIDATMGKGNDTLFLCELAREKMERYLHLIFNRKHWSDARITKDTRKRAAGGTDPRRA